MWLFLVRAKLVDWELHISSCTEPWRWFKEKGREKKEGKKGREKKKKFKTARKKNQLMQF